VSTRRGSPSRGEGRRPDVVEHQAVLLAEAGFLRVLELERKRAERGDKPCLLMLLDPGQAPFVQHKRHVLEKMAEALPAFTRETDITGWHRHEHTLGVIFTDISREGLDHILKTMLSRLKQALRASLGPEQTHRIQIYFELFPERRDGHGPALDKKMRPEVARPADGDARAAQTIS